MSEFKISPEVISVTLRSNNGNMLKAYQDKKETFKDKDFNPKDLDAAYKSGFLVKKIGKDFINFKQEKKQSQEAGDLIQSKKDNLTLEIEKAKLEIKDLDAKFADASDADKKSIEEDIKKKSKVLEKLVKDLKDVK